MTEVHQESRDAMSEGAAPAVYERPIRIDQAMKDGYSTGAAWGSASAAPSGCRMNFPSCRNPAPAPAS